MAAGPRNGADREPDSQCPLWRQCRPKSGDVGSGSLAGFGVGLQRLPGCRLDTCSTRSPHTPGATAGERWRPEARAVGMAGSGRCGLPAARCLPGVRSPSSPRCGLACLCRVCLGFARRFAHGSGAAAALGPTGTVDPSLASPTRPAPSAAPHGAAWFCERRVGCGYRHDCRHGHHGAELRAHGADLDWEQPSRGSLCGSHRRRWRGESAPHRRRHRQPHRLGPCSGRSRPVPDAAHHLSGPNNLFGRW